jgi:hypothetical protein
MSDKKAQNCLRGVVVIVVVVVVDEVTVVVVMFGGGGGGVGGAVSFTNVKCLKNLPWWRDIGLHNHIKMIRVQIPPG